MKFNKGTKDVYKDGDDVGDVDVAMYEKGTKDVYWDAVMFKKGAKDVHKDGDDVGDVDIRDAGDAV